jgi:hypothetical protein
MTTEETEEILKLLRKPNSYEEEDLIKLYEAASGNVGFGTVQFSDVLHIRASVELIRAVRKFDEASGKLVETTNKLTKRGLWLSLAALFVALASLGLSLVALRK